MEIETMDRMQRALLHAKQGVADPQFAKDQCAEIVEALQCLEPADVQALMPLWVSHDVTFASLMLGWIELAQITQGQATSDWFWTLRFCRDGEKITESDSLAKTEPNVHHYHSRTVIRFTNNNMTQ